MLQNSDIALTKQTSIVGPGTPTISSTPTAQPSIKKMYKPNIYKFLENLFKINMSQDTLVDIIISDDENDNQIIIVGRSKMLGSATKQMRHVTPYSFIEKAIKEAITATEAGADYISYIKNIVETIKPLIKSKDGICLTSDQYSKLRSNITLQSEDREEFTFSTISREQKKNDYHLIYNELLIREFNNSDNFSTDEKKEAANGFQIKFEKYINHGINYLTEKILDPRDANTITITCEGIARIILTLFNQDKYAAFPEEGNSLLEEIRLYNTQDDAKEAGKLPLHKQKQQKLFEVKYHNEITQEINDNKQYDLRIRIVDNEGSNTKKTAEALYIINSLVSSKLYGSYTKEDSQYQQYNNQYNYIVRIKDIDTNIYNQQIDNDNLANIFHYHAAKHLYTVFDFKPLELNVLAPKQNNDDNVVKIYPSATGTRLAEYSVQDGIQYRQSEVNRAKGYNDAAIFRSAINNEDSKEILRKIIIKHLTISLIPFKEIKIGCIENDTQEGMKQILNSFIELVQKNYNGSVDCNKEQINLNDFWVEQVNTEYIKYNESINLSGVSEPTVENYDV